MKRISILVIIVVALLTACAIVPAGRHGHGSGEVVIAPVLPSIVVLEAEPYYFYSNFFYYYTNYRWYYSRSKRGPWAGLPRDRYPRETRYRGKSSKHDRGRDYNRGRDYDDRNRDRRVSDRGHDNQRR